MRNITIIILSAFVILLVACTAQTNYNKQLALADSAMQVHPDSALRILQSISAQTLKTQADRAYYALLLTQAKDKNFIIQTDDSLIRIAVQYYDNARDTKMQAKAYYNWGRIYSSKNEQASALEKYLTAIPFALKANDQKLIGRIYNNAAYLYYLQDLYEKSDSIYQLVEQIGIQQKDTGLWAESLSWQGKIKLYQKLYPQAEVKLLQALLALGKFKANGIRSDISAALSSLYGRTNNGAKAIRYAKQNIILKKDTLHCYRAFLLLGDAYFKTKQYDSATIYLNRSLPSPRYAIKASVYMRLADIAKIQGDIVQSLKMERLYSTYNDSLNLSSQKSEIIEAEQQVLMHQQRTLYESFLSKHRYSILALVITVLLLLYIVCKLYKKRSYQPNDITQPSVDEERKTILQEEIIAMTKQQAVLAKKKLEHVDVYAKVQCIIEDFKVKGHSKESLTEDEWLKLIAEVDKEGIISHLSIQHGFSEKEIHLCCLLLLDLSIVDKSRVFHYDRQTIYRTEKRILAKMNDTYEAGKLQNLLKSMVNK